MSSRKRKKEPTPPPDPQLNDCESNPTDSESKTILKTTLRCVDKKGFQPHLEKLSLLFGRLAVESVNLVNLYILHHLNHHPTAPSFFQLILKETFWHRAFSLASQEWDVDLPKRKGLGQQDVDPWFDVITIYRQQVKDKIAYVPPSSDLLGEKCKTMDHATQPLKYLANTMFANFTTYLRTTIVSRVKRWVSLQLTLELLRLNKENTTMPPANIMNSVTNFIVHILNLSFSTKDKPLHKIIETLLEKYTNVAKFNALHHKNQDILFLVLNRTNEMLTENGFDRNLPSKGMFVLTINSILPALRVLRRILSDFERIQSTPFDPSYPEAIVNSCKHLAKLFVLVPTKSIGPACFRIDHTTLGYYDKMFTPKGMKVDLTDDELWKKHFVLPRRRNAVFDHSITTDGVSMNVQYTSVKQKSVVEEIEEEDDEVLEGKVTKFTPTLPTPGAMDPTKFSRIVSIDPGRKVLVAGAVFDMEAWNDLKSDGSKRFETIFWKNLKYKKESGAILCEKKTKQWMEFYAKSVDDDVIKNHLKHPERIPTKKTADIERLLTAIRYDATLSSHQIIEKVYGKKKFRRLAQHVYVRKKQTIEMMVDNITGSNNHEVGKKNCVVAFGNGSFKCTTKAGTGTIGTPRDLLLKRLRERCQNVLIIDEHNTSQLCPYCNEKVTKKDAKDKNCRVQLCSNHSLRQNGTCTDKSVRYFNRDVVGCINILKRAFYEHQKEMYPNVKGLLKESVARKDGEPKTKRRKKSICPSKDGHTSLPLAVTVAQ